MTTKSTYSIRKRLGLNIFMQATVVMALMALLVYVGTHMMVERRQMADLVKKCDLVAALLADGMSRGGVQQALAELGSTAHRRPATRIVLRDAAGATIYADPDDALHTMSDDSRSLAIPVDMSRFGAGTWTMVMEADAARDRAMLNILAATLLVVSVVGGVAVGLTTTWCIRHELRPLSDLALQTQLMSPNRLDQRLHLPNAAAELVPWITQFNGLMDRLQVAVAQLESFNADVAHELRTPLASLMGHTEVALSRERSADELREVMAGSLEELQEMSAMVQDMLFLSRTDRGARARAADIESLNTLAGKVVEFHRYAIEDAQLQARVTGDAAVRADAPLLQRAVSNLVDNAIRHAERGSIVDVAIEQQPDGRVAVSVRNQGADIAPADLPRIFDRFFRADASRTESGQRHGLGLAIVAAIARMHDGETLAQSAGGRTRVGFAIPTGRVGSVAPVA